MRIAKSLQFN